MATLQQAPRDARTLADLMRRVGDVPADRVRFRPYPAAPRDVVEIEQTEGVLCELIDGVLLEKTVGFPESVLAVYIGTVLNNYVLPRNLGLVAGPDGMMELFPGRVRIPDASFIRWDRVPGNAHQEPLPALAPNLAVEVLSENNTRAEMDAKREDYFATGAELVWEVDPRKQTVTVYTSPANSTSLRSGDTLTGDPVLPGFSLAVSELFAVTDRPR